MKEEMNKNGLTEEDAPERPKWRKELQAIKMTHKVNPATSVDGILQIIYIERMLNSKHF